MSLSLRVAVLVGLSVVSATVAAQKAPPMPSDFMGVDRALGEGGKIELRHRWFVESRGLDLEPDAGWHRSQAMTEQRAYMSRQAPPLISGAPSWESMGPAPMTMGSWVMGHVAGRTTAIAVRPGDDNTLYLGTAAGGLWKSTNAGSNWTRLSDSLDSPSIGSAQVYAGATPAQDEVWVGTGEQLAGGCYGYFGQGLYYSNNAGLTFAPRNGSGANALNLSFINTIARHPTTAQTLLVGGGGKCNADGTPSSTSGVYRSLDNGSTWTRTLSAGASMDVVFHPSNGTIAYAAINGVGLYKSTDTGATWTQVKPETNGQIHVALAPSNPAIVYLLAGVRLHRSADSGATWTQVNAAACGGQCTYNLDIDVHPTNPDRILVAALHPAISNDGGTTLTLLTSNWGSGQTVHQDIHNVRFSRTAANRLWIGSDGGLWRSEDGGTAFSNLNTDLTITQFYDIALDVRNPDRIYGGAQDNSSSVRNNNNLWNLTFVSGDGFMNASQPADGAGNGQTVFQTSYPSGGPSIYRSNNFGAPNSFSRLSNTGSSGSFGWVTPLVVTRNVLFTASSIVFKRGNADSAYISISPTLGASATVLSDPDPAGTAPLRLYAGTTAGKVWRTTDALAAAPVWTDISSALTTRVTDIATQPGNPDVMYVTRSAFTSVRLQKSIDGGGAWTSIGTGLPSVPANSVAVDPINHQRVYVGTDIGVYESTDGGSNFAPMMLGMPPGSVVSDLEVAASPHVLVAGTYGSGAWKFPLQDLAPNDNIFADGFEGAGSTIVDSGPVNHALPASIGQTGHSINWLTGNFCVCDTDPGYHLNPYASSNALRFWFWPGGSDASRAGVGSGGVYSVLSSGAVIGPASSFITVDSNPAMATWQAGVASGYLGFRFTNANTGAVNYGYVQIQTTGPAGFPATLVRYWYDRSGAAITIP